MYYDRFDDLTRSVASGVATRRQALRALGGVLLASAFGGGAARLGLGDRTAAKAKKPQTAKPQHKRRSATKRKAQGQLQAERKRKKKRHKHLPPSPCGTGRKQCADKSCVPSDQCCPGDFQCPAGPCVTQDQCCPGEKRCPDPESPTGFACVGLDDCCPGEKRCGDGCIYAQTCCPDDPYPLCGPCDEVSCSNGKYVCAGKCCANEQQCPGGACVGKNDCCPGEKPCADGSCVPSLDCCSNEKQCPDGVCVGENACCLGEKKCADGTCIPEDACCYEDPPPNCGVCERHACINGEEVCVPRETGTYCIRFDGLPGTCCNRVCTREPITCANYPWRQWNPDTCLCECRDGGTNIPGDAGYNCCPAGYPNASFGGICYADPLGTHVCMMGHHFCPSPYPDYTEWCCRDGT